MMARVVSKAYTAKFNPIRTISYILEGVLIILTHPRGSMEEYLLIAADCRELHGTPRAAYLTHIVKF